MNPKPKICDNISVTNKVMKYCHGEKKCNISADPELLGAEQCKGLELYLKTTFACVKKDILVEGYSVSEKKNITIANDESIKVMNDASTEIDKSNPINQNITTTNHSEIFVNNLSENV